MGHVDLSFRPSVPVFDANVALGRRHLRLVRVDTLKGTLESMSLAGIGRALVYSPHAAAFDSRDGNQSLLDSILGEPRMVPQFVCNPSFDDLDAFAAQVKGVGVRAIQMLPALHMYPFRDWVVGPWLDWVASEHLSLCLPAEEIDPSALVDVLSERPGVTVVLSVVHYSHLSWAMPLVRRLPNVCVEISRFVVMDGISRLMKAVGQERIIFGSRFPDSPMAPQLYHLHRCGLSETALGAICSGNLERILRMD